MTTLRTQLGTIESARRVRVEPTGGITATDVQKALEGVDAATLKNLTLVVPSELTVAGSPTSGNVPIVTVGKGNVAANLIAAGPASGAAAAWSFRPMVAADIPAGIVTYAKIQNEGASTLIGNPTGAPAAPSEITLGATLAFSATSLRTAALTGDVTSGANSFATTVAKINGTTLGSTTATAGNLLVGSGAQWASVAMSGDAALSSAGLLTIAAGAISYAKIQNVAALRLIGNSTGAPAAPSEITLGAALTFAGSALQTLAHTGDVTTPANSLVTTVAAIAGTAVSGTTGTTNVVFSGSPTITTPSIARINGGSAAGSTLELRATTGVGIGAEAVTFTGGTNGGVTLGGFYSNVGVQGRLGVGTVPTCSAEISGSGSDPLLDQYRATVSAHATNGGGSVGMAFANLGVASVGTAAVIQFGLNNITPSFRSGAALVASTQDTAVATFSADFAIQTYAAGTFATRAYVTKTGGVAIGATTDPGIGGLLVNAQIFGPNISTTASAANAFINTGSSPAGQLLRSTSSLIYKRDVEPLDSGFALKVLNNARPIFYRSKCATDNPAWSWYGLGAEDVAAIDPRLAHWGYQDDDFEDVQVATRTLPDGGADPIFERRRKADAVLKPDGVQYERLTAHLIVGWQLHEARLAGLEARLGH